MTTILIADDSRNIRDYCRQELEDEGYHVIVAADGDEAVRMANSHTPDVVVLDIWMPAMNGLDAMAHIRTTKPDMPVVFFTSYADLCAEDPRSAGASACVDKCEDLTELKQMIAAVLRLHQCGHPHHLGLPPRTGTGSPNHAGHDAALWKGVLRKCWC